MQYVRVSTRWGCKPACSGCAADGLSAPGQCCGSVTAVERRIAEVAPDLWMPLSWGASVGADRRENNTGKPSAGAGRDLSVYLESRCGASSCSEQTYKQQQLGRIFLAPSLAFLNFIATYEWVPSSDRSDAVWGAEERAEDPAPPQMMSGLLFTWTTLGYIFCRRIFIWNGEKADALPTLYEKYVQLRRITFCRSFSPRVGRET